MSVFQDKTGMDMGEICICRKNKDRMAGETGIWQNEKSIEETRIVIETTGIGIER